MSKFLIGKLVATPAASAVLMQHKVNFINLLRRHVAGDWGDLHEDDKAANDYAVEHNDGRILSAYEITPTEKVWIITEADRSSTCIMLPSDY